MTGVHVVGLLCDHRVDPLGVDAPAPLLSWRLESDRAGVAQTAYEVEVDGLWSTGRVESAGLGVRYGGPPLASRQRATWRVRVWDEAGTVTPWSEPAEWEAGMLDRDDWTASWIRLPAPPFTRDQYRPAPFLRGSFTTRGRVVRARLYATALGLYRASLNGARVSDDELRPGWTDYSQRVQYQTYDVTPLVRQGDNVLGIVLGEGWYCGHFGVFPQRGNWGPHAQARAQLVVEYEDGSVDVTGTGADWRGWFGPILASDLLQGEIYDARQSLPGWDTPDRDASAWQPAVTADDVEAPLVAQRCQPVRRTAAVVPVSVTELFGKYVFDFGQNIVGWVRLRVSGPAGAELVLQHGEALHPDGTVYTANLRAATSVDRYIVGGDGEEVWEPSFTLHGFRYVEMTGFPGVPGPDALTGIVVHTDLPETGSFTCSNELVNRIHRNTVWSIRGNFVDVPTDCPQRNERLGWTGDVRIISRTASFSFDTAAFFAKWLADVRLARSPDGFYPDFAPWTGPMREGGPGWSDAGVFLPMDVYNRTGDVGVLEENYEAMAQFVDVVAKENPDLVRVNRVGMNWGDWLSLPETDPDQGRQGGPIIDSVHSTTPKDVFATAMFAKSAQLVGRAATALGREDDAARYARLAADIRRVWNERFVSDDGRIEGNTQTAYALALCFDLVPDELRALVSERLVERVSALGYMTTGNTGTELVLPALTAAGRLDLAYALLLSEDYPSWGYTIRNGATTMWERWDGWTEEHGFQDVRMNSFNHYSLGSVCAWVYATVGGLAVDESVPGGTRFVVRPRPGGGVTWAKTTHRSRAGEASVAWELSADGNLSVDVVIPPCASALVDLPGRDPVAVGPGRHHFPA